MKKHLFTSLIFISLLFTKNADAQLTIGNTTVDTLTLISGLSTPWEVQYGSDDHLWFTERTGKINRLNPVNKQNKVILDFRSTVNNYGEGGMLGLALHPNFSTTPKVYVVYTYGSNSNLKEKLVSFDYNAANDTLTNEQTLIAQIPAAVNHDGSRLQIDGNGHIFMSTGDAINQPSAQNTNILSGKILRLNLDGSIPTDNPIPNSPLWSWGHRNPQGLFLANGFLYSSEHGPNNDDEINIIKKGRNYGWPTVQGFCNTTNEITFCTDSNVVEPLFAWTPTVATSDIVYYNHPAIPEFQNSILLTTLKDETIHQLPLNAQKDSILSDNEYFANVWGRLRDIAIGPLGELYIATNSGTHSIIKISNPNYTSIIDNQLKKDKVIIFPNPSSTDIKVLINSSIEAKEYRLYDLKGQLVAVDSILSNNFIIEKKPTYNGVYVLKISTDTDNISHKIIFK